jgi:hypothetical protein
MCLIQKFLVQLRVDTMNGGVFDGTRTNFNFSKA